MGEGTVQRLRPKIMTITTMAAGLLPLLWAQGSGSEIMKRVAAPMLGGLATSAFLTLEVLPVLYTLWARSTYRKTDRGNRRRLIRQQESPVGIRTRPRKGRRCRWLEDQSMARIFHP